MHENQWTAMQTEMTVFANAQVDILKLVSFMTAVTILLVRSNRKSFARRRSRRSRVELPLGLPTESLNARMASEKKVSSTLATPLSSQANYQGNVDTKSTKNVPRRYRRTIPFFPHRLLIRTPDVGDGYAVEKLTIMSNTK